MAIPRAQQVDLDVTPYYHCVTRCVRRAFLCGEDPLTGRNLDHRKGWVVERIKLLAEVFAVDICAYAVMSNHLHLVVRMDRDRAEVWKAEEIAQRVQRIFRSAFDGLDDVSAELRDATVETWRHRLASLSWMMRCLDEWIARRANREDKCTGRFWEGRFRSQALLDIGAVVACMSYVDLNPVRAGVASSLESSAHTSIQERLQAIAKADQQGRQQPTAPPGLAALAGDRARMQHPERLEISLRDYVELVDWTGRVLREDKRGAISGPPPRLLRQTGLNEATWIDNVSNWGAKMWTVVGETSAVQSAATKRGIAWCKGKRNAATLYRAS